MLIGYARVSKSDGSQVLDLQIDALIEAGVQKENIYTDRASVAKEDRVGLEHCLKALRADDILVVWKLDRLGRSLKHLISTVDDLTQRKVGFKVLSGQGVNIDTTTPSGRMVFSIFAVLSEFERELNRERTIAGLQAARARGRKVGVNFNLLKLKLD
jgi:DNA invertase Pin-like site-specific DNA recombinase